MGIDRAKLVAVKGKENEAIQKQLEEREAGVAELFDLYSQVEAIYVSASKALEEGYAVRASSSTNFR
jgi:hypothetical protein